MHTKVTDSLIRHIYRPLPSDSHKGSRGHALLIVGSYGKIGAAVLATKCCVKSGAGLTTVFVPSCGYDILQVAVPEAMVITDVHREHITNIQYDIFPKGIGIGPGIGQEEATVKALHTFLQQNAAPIVVDADALNILARHPEWLELLPAQSILTPHKKELERLIGEWGDESDKLDRVVSFSGKYHCVIVVKGAPTRIVDGDSIYENTTGNAALANGGTGDCLTGILTGLLAQGYAACDAALLGVFLHGRTADIGITETGYEAFTAGMIPDYLGRAFIGLYGNADH